MIPRQDIDRHQFSIAKQTQSLFERIQETFLGLQERERYETDSMKINSNLSFLSESFDPSE